MYGLEKSFLRKIGIELNIPCEVLELAEFESQHKIQMTEEIGEFYLQLNGYYNEDEMGNLYPLENVEKVSESHWHIPKDYPIDQYFILGDFGFQATFWLLEVLENDYKLYALNPGGISLPEITQPFNLFIGKLLEEPYSVIMVGR